MATVEREPRTVSTVATFYVHNTGDDMYWRSKAPAKAIRAELAVIGKDDALAAFTEPNTTTALPWSIEVTLPDGRRRRVNTPTGWSRLAKKQTQYTSIQAVFPEHRGAAVFIRPGVPQTVLGEQMRAQGIRVLAETDDNYLADQNLNLLLRSYGMSEADRFLHAKCMARQEAIVFSTLWLRDRYYEDLRRRFGKKGLPEMFVCRNNIDFREWPTPAERNGPLRVGFMGSTSHVWDVNLAYPAFAVAKEEGATTTMIGYSPTDPDRGVEIVNRSAKSADYIQKWRGVVDTHIPWVESDEYHRAALPLDIGLCPLLYNDFTSGKSDVKAIEYTISGAAVVAMNVPVYNETWRHEETCLLVSNMDEMALAVRRLLRDPKLRYELVTNAQDYVREERGETQMRREWMDAVTG